MAKVYSTDNQVPDSAATATAIFTGVKAPSKSIGVNPVSNKKTKKSDRLPSIMDWAQAVKKRTGNFQKKY